MLILYVSFFAAAAAAFYSFIHVVRLKPESYGQKFCDDQSNYTECTFMNNKWNKMIQRPVFVHAFACVCVCFFLSLQNVLIRRMIFSSRLSRLNSNKRILWKDVNRWKERDSQWCSQCANEREAKSHVDNTSAIKWKWSL